MFDNLPRTDIPDAVIASAIGEVPLAHEVAATTHKTLRDPRGGVILTNDEALAKTFSSAVLPGNQGGPLMQVIAATAVAFGEALQPDSRAEVRALCAAHPIYGA